MALSLKQEKFVAAYVGVANGNATEAARLAGYKGTAVTLASVASENLRKPYIAEAIAAYRAEVKRQGIRALENRLDAQDDRWNRINGMISARAEYFKDDPLPDARLGLMIRRLKSARHSYEPDPNDEDGKPVQVTEEVWEYETDIGLLREARELEKHVAQETGQWTEKREITGAGGGPLEITGIEIARPAGPS